MRCVPDDPWAVDCSEVFDQEDGSRVWVFDGGDMMCLTWSRCCTAAGRILKSNGRCQCRAGFTGPDCDHCENSRLAGDNCDECAPRFSGETCAECAPRFTGSYCEECDDPHFAGPDCDECASRFIGPNDDQCASPRFVGTNCAMCAPRFDGENCDTCRLQHRL